MLALTTNAFGELTDGRRVDAFQLKSSSVELTIINYGGIITSLRLPDRRSRFDDVVLGYDSLDAYLRDPHYLGAIVGRYANRIAHGRFNLDNVTYQLAQNDGIHHLHGGGRGFDKHLWHAASGHSEQALWVRLTRRSDAGEEGYPGTLNATVTYTLLNAGVFTIEYHATASAPTVVNLTQHSYFNLAGWRNGTILDHELSLHAAQYLPVEEGLIPSGVVAAVDRTPFDFRAAETIGERLQSGHEQLRRAGGFDHNWILQGGAGELTPAATLRHGSSGRILRVSTTEPGLQFYDGHFLGPGRTSGTVPRFDAHAGLCLETQHFPDSPNQPSFPATVLRPGNAYRSTTSWQFGCD